MSEGLVFQQQASFGEEREDWLIGIAHAQASEEFHVRLEAPVIVHRLVERQTILGTHIKIFNTVGRSGVDQTGARIQCYVLAENYGHGAIEERVSQDKAVELATVAATEQCTTQAIPGQTRSLQIGGENQQASFGLHKVIDEIRLDCHGLAAR
jgi:fumarate hydratase class II